MSLAVSYARFPALLSICHSSFLSSSILAPVSSVRGGSDDTSTATPRVPSLISFVSTSVMTVCLSSLLM